MNDQIKPKVIEKPLAGGGQSPTPLTPSSSATGHSPKVVLKPFTFKVALDKMIEGKKVRKLEWDKEGSKKDHGFIHKPSKQLQVFRETTGENHTWILCEGDILGEDYVIVE